MDSFFSSHEERNTPERQVWIKRSMVVLPLLCLLLFGTAIGSRLIGNATSAEAASLVPLTGYVPGLVKTSKLIGPTDPNQSLSLSVGLQLRNAVALKAFADNAIRSRSTHMPQHLTSAQIAGAFAPLASNQQAVIDYMQGYGFKVTTTQKQHLVVGFKGSVGEAENAFHLQINHYHSPGGEDFYAPADNPAVPQNLAGIIQDIIGLNNIPQFTHQSGNYTAATPPVGTSPKITAQGINCSLFSAPMHGGGWLTPSQTASAYNLNGFYNAGYSGEGQSIALFEVNDYIPSDISAYTNCYGGSHVPIYKVMMDPVSTGIDSLQTEADMELILSAVPHLAGLYVYETDNNPSDSSSYIDQWAQIVNDAVPVVSTGWSHCEPSTGDSAALQVVQEENLLFTLAAAEGQTIFAAAGNSGTNCDPGGGLPATTEDPASQPYVTGVGGTSLTLQSDYKTYASETVWNNGYLGELSGSMSYVYAGGGGISSLWSMPSWQQGPGVNNNYSSGTPCGATSGYCREVPDVSFNADIFNSAYPVYCTEPGSCLDKNIYKVPYGLYSGGTSAASDMWAAFMALTNEKTLHDGGFNVGFLNPYLYQVAQNSTMYANDFHDVTSGGNDGFPQALGSNSGPYQASPGYDMASGLGSYNAWNLANDLEKLANAQNSLRGAPAATTWYIPDGEVGNSYKDYITILNPTTSDATITVEYLFPNKAPLTITHTAPANTRVTVNVNTDLGVAQTAGQQSVSEIVTATQPIVVEQPMYFNVYGVASGTDVQGATSTATGFYFAAGDSRSSSSATSHEVIALLNANSTTANVTVTYYSGGKAVETDHVTVAAQSRGTASPSFHGQTAIQVTSDQPIVAERTEYFKGNVTNAGGQTTGGSSTMGVTTQGTDWLFAEGYTGGGFQENLALGNVSSTAATATIKLEYTNGTVQMISNISVPAQSQVIFDVNNANAHPNCSPTSNPPCTVSNSVSIEVTSTAPIVAERVQYFHFGLNGSMHPGMDDTVGQPGPASQTTYSFAEGSCGVNFNDWLTLQNPNNTSVVVAVTVFADNTIIQKEMTLPAHSRTSILINDIVNPLVAAYPNSAGYTVSMDVQSLGGPIVAERPLYFVFSGTTGASSIIGFTGH